MPLSDLLSAERIAALPAPTDCDAVLDAASRLLSKGAPSQGVASRGDAAAIADSLRQRERLGSTAIGHGVAIPHGRSRDYAQARAAFLRLDTPVDFGAADGQPVDLVFAMVVPEHFTQEHLQWLAELAERFAEPALRDALRSAVDAAALQALLMPPRAAAAA